MPATKLFDYTNPEPERSAWHSEDDVIERVCAGDSYAFAQLMRRHNRRVFRVVRSILRDQAEAEDAVQDTWLAVFKHLGAFERKAAFSTWLTRIAIRCAISRGAKRSAHESLEAIDWLEPESPSTGPGDNVQRKELAQLLEHAIDNLPADYRLVVTLRHLERMSTKEAAAALGVSEENVRVRLHRAHAALRRQMADKFGKVADEVFSFGGERCDRTIATVLEKLRQLSS